MKNTILFFFLLLAAAVSAQSNSFVTDRLRAAEYFRIGTNTSQKVTGFDKVITAPGTHDSLPTSRAVVDFLEANFTPIGYYTAGTGISISDDVITNAAPDQVVGLTGGGIAVSGTYPNFTLTAADQSATNELQTLSIDGSDLTLSNGGGTVTLPGGADGNGIYSGSGVLSGNTLVDLNLNNLTFDNGQFSFSTGEGGVFSMSGTTINVNGDGNFEGGTYGFLAEENLFFVGNGNIQVTSGNGLGFEYTTEYPDILTNDRSIPDVGLTKQLISSENGALGTGFTGGGGNGTIPGANVVISGGDLNIDNQASVSISMGDVQGNGQGIGLRLSDITFQFGNPFGAGNYSVISNIDGSDNFISIQTPDKEFKFDATSAKFYDLRATPIGLEYAAEYPDILTNDRSIPDVGLTKQLISSENGALGTGFTGGGGSGTIPDATTATLQTGGSFGGREVRMLFGAPSYIQSIGDNFPEFGMEDYDADNSVAAFFGYSSEESGRFSFGAINENTGASSGFSATPDQISLSAKTINYTINSNGGNGIKITDARTTKKGAEYAADYSETIKTNDRSLPDVGTVNILKQTPASYTNAAAPNNTIFYSTTDSKLSYKDPAGVVHNLY